MSRVRVLIADAPRFVIAGEASRGYEALELARELMPDLILMDIGMPRRKILAKFTVRPRARTAPGGLQRLNRAKPRCSGACPSG